MRFETDAGALVLATLLAAHQRGVAIRLVYNVDHPGPIPVPPPPETKPEAIEALPVPTRGIAGIPDLMHHKFVVRDAHRRLVGLDELDGRLVEPPGERDRAGARRRRALARAFTLDLDELWEQRHGRAHGAGRAAAGRRSTAASRCGPGSRPEYGDALSHRVAKFLGRARRRIRIASPVLTSGPILARSSRS